MTEERWTAVDRYLGDLLVSADPALEAALAASAAAGLPAINVSPVQGKLLYLLARAIDARNILEIGTLGGYSTIWLARALPDGGRLISLEADPRHAEIARANIARAGLQAIVEVRVGMALDTLPGLAAERSESFDVVFIDADKPNNVAYFDWALKLARPGSIIVVDNVVRDGEVIEADSDSATVQGVRRLLERLAAEPRVSATAIRPSAPRATTASRSHSSPRLHSLPLSLNVVGDWHDRRRRSYTHHAARKTGRFRTNPRHGAASVPPALGTAGGNPAARLVDRRGREPCVRARDLALFVIFSAGCRLRCRSSSSHWRAPRRALPRGKPRLPPCRFLPHPPPIRPRVSPAPKPNAPGFMSSREARWTPIPSRARGDC